MSSSSSDGGLGIEACDVAAGNGILVRDGGEGSGGCVGGFLADDPNSQSIVSNGRSRKEGTKVYNRFCMQEDRSVTVHKT